MLKQRFLVHFGTNFITHFLGIIAGIIVARIAGPSVVGVLSYGTAYVSILGFITGIFGSAHIKLVSEGRDQSSCLAVYGRLRGISAIIYFIATAGMFLIQKYLLNYQFESKEIQIVILLSLIAHFLSIYEGYSNVVYTANLKQAKANLPGFFRDIAWHIGRVVIVILGFRAITLATYKMILSVLVVLYCAYLLKEFPKGKYDKILAKQFFKFGIPSLIIVIINNITGYADKLLLAHYTNTTQLGYYSAAFSLGGMFMLIAMPVSNIFFPLFSKMISMNNWEGVNINIFKYQEFIILFLFPIMCILAITIKDPLLLVLGKRYKPSVTPLIILLFSTYVVLLGLPYANVITGMGKFYIYAWTNVIKLVIFIISITIFVSPRFLNLGATGLAYNQLVLNLTGNLVYLFYVMNYGKVRLFMKNNIRHLVIILISFAAFLGSKYVKNTYEYWWLFYIPLYLIVCYGILIKFKLIGKEHWLLLTEALNIKKTLNYAKDEMSNRDV